MVLFIILIIIIGSYLLDLLVNYLNIRHLSSIVPQEFEGYYEHDKYEKSQSYLKDTTIFSMIRGGILTAVSVIFILIGGFKWVDQIAHIFQLSVILRGLLFAGILLLISEVILLPFSAYSTFVIEDKYHFNRMNVRTFMLDFFKSFLLILLLGGLAFAGIIWFFEVLKTWAWLYGWGGLTIFQLFVAFVAPITILPLFNRFAPLGDNELKMKIEAYARQENFKMNGIFVMDGSRRSTKSNAFFTGFARFRRIILFDTLIKNQSVNELVAVLGHEMGHYKRKHILKLMFLSFLTTGLMFYLLSFMINYQPLFNAFQIPQPSTYAGIVLFSFLFVPVELLISIFGNWLSRRYEFEADAYAANTISNPEDMITALKKLSVDNLANLTPHPLKIFVSYSHPPVLQRILAIRKGIVKI